MYLGPDTSNANLKYSFPNAVKYSHTFCANLFRHSGHKSKFDRFREMRRAEFIEEIHVGPGGNPWESGQKSVGDDGQMWVSKTHLHQACQMLMLLISGGGLGE